MSSTFSLSVSIGFGIVALACGGSFATADPNPDGGTSGGSGSGGERSHTGGARSTSGGADGSGGRTAGNGGIGGRSGGNGGNGAGGVRGSGGSIGDGGITGSGGSIGNGGTVGSGGISATGGVVSSGGVRSSGGTGGGSCPASLPANGALCGSDSLQCSYGTCCPTVARCQSGAWNVIYPPCNAPTCPTSPPANGSMCSCQLEGKTCDINLCSSGGTHTAATCTSGIWANKDLGCGADQCATIACTNGTICMALTVGAGPSASCVSSTCSAGIPTDACSCIGAACQNHGGICSDLMSGGALCTVPVP